MCWCWIPPCCTGASEVSVARVSGPSSRHAEDTLPLPGRGRKEGSDARACDGPEDQSVRATIFLVSTSSRSPEMGGNESGPYDEGGPPRVSVA